VFAGSYLILGKFNPELELDRRPTGEVIGLENARHEAHAKGNRELELADKQRILAARANALGTKEEWSGYGLTIGRYETEAVEQGYAKDVKSLRSLERRTVADSWVTMDTKGGLWLDARDGTSHPRVGLSANTLMEPGSDAKTGYLVALARVDAELRKTPKNRETLGFFRKDWELMERLRGQVVPVAAEPHAAEPHAAGLGGGALP
jgi:hypothetical protein